MHLSLLLFAEKFVSDQPGCAYFYSFKNLPIDSSNEIIDDDARARARYGRQVTNVKLRVHDYLKGREAECVLQRRVITPCRMPYGLGGRTMASDAFRS